MFECIICREDFDENDVTSPCNHGPYCQSCYDLITSQAESKCSICRGILPRSSNYQSEQSQDISQRYEILEVIGYSDSFNPNGDSVDNGSEIIQVIEPQVQLDMYSTPPRRPRCHNDINNNPIREDIVLNLQNHFEDL